VIPKIGIEGTFFSTECEGGCGRASLGAPRSAGPVDDVVDAAAVSAAD
jgi:hypothetical protein